MTPKLNVQSTEYTGDVTLPTNYKRGYLFIYALDADLTVELGSGGGALPIPLGGYYEPCICPTSSISIKSTGSFVVITNTGDE